MNSVGSNKLRDLFSGYQSFVLCKYRNEGDKHNKLETWFSHSKGQQKSAVLGNEWEFVLLAAELWNTCKQKLVFI